MNEQVCICKCSVINFLKELYGIEKELPIRPSEMGVLNIITEIEGPHTPIMLAELLGVSKPMITAHTTS